MLGVNPRRELPEVNPTKESEVQPHDPATERVPQLSTGARFDVLLVADAPVDILGSSHHFGSWESAVFMFTALPVRVCV